MVTVLPLSHPDGNVALGGHCTFRIAKAEAGIETRAYLRHGRIRFPRPLSEWTTREEVAVFPEAPGDYRLVLAWRAPGGASGLVESRFRVTGGSDDASPRISRIGRSGRAWLPSAWEASLLRRYEEPVYEALARVVSPGWTVFDVGASLGQFSLRFSRLVGAAGQVYCFEANPLCVYFLNASLQLRRIGNCEIIPVAVLDRPRLERFVLNYGNFGLGLAEASAFFGGKSGHEIAVNACGLDELIETHRLRKPDLVKIDIEGAEPAAIAGMATTLERHRPALLIEVHGRDAAEKTFGAGVWDGYRFEHPLTGRSFPDAAALLAWRQEVVFQVLCLPG